MTRAWWLSAVVAATVVSLSCGHMAPHKLSLYHGADAEWDRVDATASAVASPAIINDGDVVTVTFYNPTPATADFVAAYSPGSYVGTSSAPVEYFYAKTDPGYLKTGNGTLTFRCINMRSDYVFALLSGGPTSPRLVAQSNSVTFNNPNAPRAVRLALTTSRTEMRVTWSSSRNDLNPRVVVTSTGATLPAQSNTYTAADLCGAPASTVGYRDPGFIHTAVLTGLVPGKAYTYHVGDDSEMTADFTFTQPPLGDGSGGNTYPFGFATVGDMGQDTTDASTEASEQFPTVPNNTALIAADVAAGNVTAFLHVGDVSYARGYASNWDVFFDNVKGVTPFIPYMVNQGNHERDYPNSWVNGTEGPGWLNGTDSGGECGVPTSKLFNMPQPSGQDLYWFARMGPVFTLHFSTELDFTTGSPQWTFIKDALLSVNRSDTPWVVVGFHRPMYISSTNWAPVGGDQTVAIALRQHVEPLFNNAGGSPVDLVLQGHHHSYQRMCAVWNNGTCYARSAGDNNVYANPGAPVHIVIGTGGAGYSTNVMSPPPPYAEVVDFWHGYARVTVHSASMLEWTMHDDTAGGVVRDTFWIYKGQ